ncbi:DUF1177 domain-containing protein [Candidatus Gottesmanbacteria bacterium]|nr:DUF1177 domain-containing protein [Candidatus Gottesmanbacteria bacterium]
MLLKEILEIYELIDRPGTVAASVLALFKGLPVQTNKIEVKEKKGLTDFVKIIIPGKKGKSAKGKAPTIGIIGRLGGVGARPEAIGFVSDGDGALTALSVALKLARMKSRGDEFEGDVIVATHLCTNAPTMPHDPVPFMGSPVELATMNKYEVDQSMDAILSIDTSRGNKIINTVGFAITPTVKEGWILKVSDDLLTMMEYVTGKPPTVVPITLQDITPYGNGVYHFNSIMQPTVATQAPVVGIAITGEVPVPGCGTGVTNAYQIDLTGRYVVEVAQAYTKGKLIFYNKEEFVKITQLYGSLKKLQTLGKK